MQSFALGILETTFPYKAGCLGFNKSFNYNGTKPGSNEKIYSGAIEFRNHREWHIISKIILNWENHQQTVIRSISPKYYLNFS